VPAEYRLGVIAEGSLEVFLGGHRRLGLSEPSADRI
jgi:hypothetical protein